MVRVDELAEAALTGDALKVRSLAQDWLLENPHPTDCPAPQTTNPNVLAVAAAIVELLCEHAQRPIPAWTARIGPGTEPIYLLKSAATMPRLRAMCEAEAPPPLRRRNLFAPADYLRFA